MAKPIITNAAVFILKSKGYLSARLKSGSLIALSDLNDAFEEILDALDFTYEFLTILIDIIYVKIIEIKQCYLLL